MHTDKHTTCARKAVVREIRVIMYSGVTERILGAIYGHISTAKLNYTLQSIHTIYAVSVVKLHDPVDTESAGEEEKTASGKILKPHVVVLWYGMVWYSICYILFISTFTTYCIIEINKIVLTNVHTHTHLAHTRLM